MQACRKDTEYCIKHINEHLGGKMIIEITAETVLEYQSVRLRQKAAGKTINEEVGELFRILGDTGEAVRRRLLKDKKLKLPQREDVGRALSAKEEAKLIEAARASTSPHIHPALVLTLNTGLRDGEMRTLTWDQIDFLGQILTVGKSKTAEGTGRTIPLNGSVLRAMADHMRWFEESIGEAKGPLFVFP